MLPGMQLSGNNADSTCPGLDSCPSRLRGKRSCQIVCIERLHSYLTLKKSVGGGREETETGREDHIRLVHAGARRQLCRHLRWHAQSASSCLLLTGVNPPSHFCAPGSGHQKHERNEAGKVTQQRIPEAPGAGGATRPYLQLQGQGFLVQ